MKVLLALVFIVNFFAILSETHGAARGCEDAIQLFSAKGADTSFLDIQVRTPAKDRKTAIAEIEATFLKLEAAGVLVRNREPILKLIGGRLPSVEPLYRPFYNLRVVNEEQWRLVQRLFDTKDPTSFRIFRSGYEEGTTPMRQRLHAYVVQGKLTEEIVEQLDRLDRGQTEKVRLIVSRRITQGDWFNTVEFHFEVQSAVRKITTFGIRVEHFDHQIYGSIGTGAASVVGSYGFIVTLSKPEHINFVLRELKSDQSVHFDFADGGPKLRWLKL